ncbi:MAG: hypothetical protein ACXWIZ_14800 [Caldimonas sp.]
MAVEFGEAARRFGLVVAAGDEAEDFFAEMPQLVQRARHDDACSRLERARCPDVGQGLSEFESRCRKGSAARALEAEARQPGRTPRPGQRRTAFCAQRRPIVNGEGQERAQEALQGGQGHWRAAEPRPKTPMAHCSGRRP